MHDFVTLESAGVVAAFVASVEFVVAARTQGAALGYAAVPSIFVPHPIQDRTDEELHQLAENALPAILAAVTGAPRPT